MHIVEHWLVYTDWWVFHRFHGKSYMLPLRRLLFSKEQFISVLCQLASLSTVVWVLLVLV